MYFFGLKGCLRQFQPYKNAFLMEVIKKHRTFGTQFPNNSKEGLPANQEPSGFVIFAANAPVCNTVIASRLRIYF
jgi:hypothetical protein